MAKRIRFPLLMDNDVEVRDMESLKEYFSLPRVMEYLRTGKLTIWLRDRYLFDLAEKIDQIDICGEQVACQVCDVLGIEYNEKFDKDLEKSIDRMNRIENLKRYTEDLFYIRNIDNVAFSQEELNNLLEEQKRTVYLCGNRFFIPLEKRGITYIGINNPTVVIDSKVELDLSAECIFFNNVSFDEKYLDICQKSKIKRKYANMNNLPLHSAVQFGDYTWQILDKQDNRILLLADSILFHKKVNEDSGCEWEDCDIRKWLNNDFFYSFPEIERSMICEVNNNNEASIEIFFSYNPQEEKCKCNKTLDRIFLLSREEFKKYFEYAVLVDGGIKVYDNIPGAWFLRTPVKIYPKKPIYLFSGITSTKRLENHFITQANGIRPAMWIAI